jgi:hypothetical protein
MRKRRGILVRVQRLFREVLVSDFAIRNSSFIRSFEVSSFEFPVKVSCWR